MERELTNLEYRLLKFLDMVDTITEGEGNSEKWFSIKERMKQCKEDCKVEFGLVSNEYCHYIHLPFEYKVK